MHPKRAVRIGGVLSFGECTYIHKYITWQSVCSLYKLNQPTFLFTHYHMQNFLCLILPFLCAKNRLTKPFTCIKLYVYKKMKQKNTYS